MTAHDVLTKSMAEEDLLLAVTDALTLYGWTWTHHRRSDRALTMGMPGVPDIIGAKAGRLLFLELKSDKGQLSQDQWRWWHALQQAASEKVRVQVLRPGDLDGFLRDPWVTS